MSPSVAICIPTHNRAALLERALRSALAQEYASLEVVVTDDGSADDTAQVLAEIGAMDSRLRVNTHAEPRGACAARNTAVESTDCELVTFLDDDDTLAPDHVSNLVASYSDERAFVCASQLIIEKSSTTHFRAHAGLIDLESLLHYNKVGNHALVRRDRFLAVGGFDPAFAALQDYDLWVRLVSSFGACLKLSETTYHLHIDHDSPRISQDAIRKGKAIDLFVSKHRGLLSSHHRASLELLKIRECEEEASLLRLLTLVRPGNIRAVLYLCLSRHLPAVYGVLRSFRSQSR